MIFVFSRGEACSTVNGMVWQYLGTLSKKHYEHRQTQQKRSTQSVIRGLSRLWLKKNGEDWNLAGLHQTVLSERERGPGIWKVETITVSHQRERGPGILESSNRQSYKIIPNWQSTSKHHSIARSTLKIGAEVGRRSCTWRDQAALRCTVLNCTVYCYRSSGRA